MKKTLILLLIFSLLVGCSSEAANNTGGEPSNPATSPTSKVAEVEVSQQEPLTLTEDDFAPEDLDYQDFLGDYDYFWQTLDTSYPFLGVVERSGVKLAGLEKFGRERITEDTTFKEFAFIMNETVNQFGFAGHIEFFYPAEAYNSYKKIYGVKDEADSPHIIYLSEIVNNPKTVKAYKYIDDTYSESSSSSATTEKSERIVTPAENNAVPKIIEEGKVAYVEIKSFSYDNVEHDEETLLPFFESVKDYPHLIIDIRENGGGSDWYWSNNLLMPLFSQPLTIKTELLFNNTPEIRNYIQRDDRVVIPLEEYSPLPNLNSNDREKLSHIMITEATLTIDDFPEDNTVVGFQGKLWLLVSDNVYSSSESFTMLCKSSGFATIVGTNTGGDGGGIDPMMFALPNTGLVWRNSALYSINPDGSSNEEVGTTPDVLVENSKDALDACLSEIGV